MPGMYCPPSKRRRRPKKRKRAVQQLRDPYVYRSLRSIPARTRVKMSAAKNFNVVGTLVSDDNVDLRIRANSPHDGLSGDTGDPLYTASTPVAGDQPVGWDQFIGMYDNFDCYACTVHMIIGHRRVTATDPFTAGTGYPGNIVCVLQASKFPQNTTSILAMMAQPRSRTEFLAPDYGSQVRFRMHHTSKQILGGQPDASDDTTDSTVDLPWFYRLKCAIRPGNKNIGLMLEVQVKVDYYVEFYGPKDTVDT